MTRVGSWAILAVSAMAALSVIFLIYLAVSGAEPLAIVAALLIGLAAVGTMLLVFIADTAWRAIGVARDLFGPEPPETSR